MMTEDITVSPLHSLVTSTKGGEEAIQGGNKPLRLVCIPSKEGAGLPVLGATLNHSLRPWRYHSCPLPNSLQLQYENTCLILLSGSRGKGCLPNRNWQDSFL